MARWPDNVVLTRSASKALCREFIGWQCRLRQLAARQEGGRPSSGMRPRVMTPEGDQLSPGIVTLIVESEPQVSTELFRYQYLKTQDPNERFDKMLEILQSSHFQEPARFSDLMTALFGPGSTLAALLAAEGRCILEFEQYTQGYRIPCAVARLAARQFVVGGAEPLMKLGALLLVAHFMLLVARMSARQSGFRIDVDA